MQNNFFRSAWAFLNRPIPGTQRLPPVFIEGRLSKKQLLIFAFLSFIPFYILSYLFKIKIPLFINENYCTEGFIGYSLGTELIVLLLLFSVLIGWMSVIFIMKTSYDMWRNQRNIPLGKKPWIRCELIEGERARKKGIAGMVACVALVFLLVYGSIQSYKVSNFFLKPVSALKGCSSPAHAQTPHFDFLKDFS